MIAVAPYDSAMTDLIFMSIPAIIIIFLMSGILQPKYAVDKTRRELEEVRLELARMTTMPRSSQPDYVPYDPDYAAIGMIEPVMSTSLDWEAFERMYPSEEVETIEARSFDGTVILHTIVPPAKVYEDPPTKTELRWRPVR